MKRSPKKFKTRLVTLRIDEKFYDRLRWAQNNYGYDVSNAFLRAEIHRRVERSLDEEWMMTNLNRFQESIIETLNEIIIELNARSRQIAPDNVSDDVVH